MKINLSELEKLAENHIHGYLCTDVGLMPHTLMTLIRVARFAKILMELVEEDGRLPEREIQPMREALEEIEP